MTSDAAGAGDAFGGLTGRTAVMRELFGRLAAVAPTDSTVLITGETGTGKELVAAALHDHSPRRQGPFVVLDCGAIPPNLMESEAFGHERGAFTGATTAREGAFERANGGTLFLDEIGELPLDMQPKLLRALESKEVRRLGGSKVTRVDIRVIAATNRDLQLETHRGRFREDLYYRLAVALLTVPPLRDRKDDISLLIGRIVAALPGAGAWEPKPRTIEALMAHSWPGNVRELRNVVERAALLKQPALVRPLAAVQAAEPGDEPPAATPAAPPGPLADLQITVDPAVPFKLAKQNLIADFERSYVRKILKAHRGNVTAAARHAGIDRMSFHKLLNRLGLGRHDV